MAKHIGLDVLALGAHPDDVELAAGGAMCLMARQGHRVGIVDLTRGELGSRGDPEGRRQEAEAAAGIIGLEARENLGIPDGDIAPSKENQLGVIRMLRRYRPRIVLTHPMRCRHPDHSAAAQLTVDACFYSGLRKIETSDADTAEQQPWRPHHILHYAEVVPFEPTLVVDVTETWEQRTRALQAYKSQFFNPEYEPGADEPETFVSNAAFFQWIEARARMYGYAIGATYGEAFLYRGLLGVSSLANILQRERPFH